MSEFVFRSFSEDLNCIGNPDQSAQSRSIPKRSNQIQSDQVQVSSSNLITLFRLKASQNCVKLPSHPSVAKVQFGSPCPKFVKTTQHCANPFLSLCFIVSSVENCHSAQSRSHFKSGHPASANWTQSSNTHELSNWLYPAKLSATLKCDMVATKFTSGWCLLNIYYVQCN